MDNPEKLATLGTQDEDKQHNTTCVGHYYTQARTNNANKSSYKQLDVKTNRTSLQAKYNHFTIQDFTIFNKISHNRTQLWMSKACFLFLRCTNSYLNKGNDKNTELRTILQRESRNS